MAIQFERRQWEPHRPSRKNDQPIHKFWTPKVQQNEPQQYRQIKAKTPQPSTNKKTVSFWETKKETSSLSKSMVSLVQHEVDEKRGFTPSDVAKDPVKREFLTNLSKKIFSPSDKKMTRSFRVRRPLAFPP